MYRAEFIVLKVDLMESVLYRLTVYTARKVAKKYKRKKAELLSIQQL